MRGSEKCANINIDDVEYLAHAPHSGAVRPPASNNQFEHSTCGLWRTGVRISKLARFKIMRIKFMSKTVSELTGALQCASHSS